MCFIGNLDRWLNYLMDGYLPVFDSVVTDCGIGKIFQYGRSLFVKTFQIRLVIVQKIVHSVFFHLPYSLLSLPVYHAFMDLFDNILFGAHTFLILIADGTSPVSLLKSSSVQFKSLPRIRYKPMQGDSP